VPNTQTAANGKEKPKEKQGIKCGLEEEKYPQRHYDKNIKIYKILR